MSKFSISKQEVYSRCAKEGFFVSVWTVDMPEDIEHMKNWVYTQLHQIFQTVSEALLKTIQ